MTKELHILVGGVIVGRLSERAGKHEIEYSSDWIARGAGAFPLSLSMPLPIASHRGQVVTNWLWNLLPDNAGTINGWARKFQVSPSNPFGILTHTGEDCPGSVQFVREDRLFAVQRDGGVVWLTENDVAERLRGLQRDAGSSSGREAGETGQFSLAGAQPKTAFHYADGRWGVPDGRIPTTHILKPATGQHDGHPENEHVCLQLATAHGMRSARSTVLRFEDQVAIVVERFDRIRREGRTLRLHQEDCCQALGIHPERKYENEGGPGVKDIVMGVMKRCENFNEARGQFLRAVMLDQIICATDQHAKNYSIQIVPGPRIRLAPLYDIASYLPYAKDSKNVKMAMRVGKKYRPEEIMPRHWAAEAKACGVNEDEALSWFYSLVQRTPDFLADVIAATRAKGLDHPVFALMQDKIGENCKRLSRIYGNDASSVPLVNDEPESGLSL